MKNNIFLWTTDPFIGVLCGYGIFLAGFACGHIVIRFHDGRGICYWLLLSLCVGSMVAALGWILWLQWLDLQQDEHSGHSQSFLAAWKIYEASAPGFKIHPARFYDKNAEALADMKRLAEAEAPNP